MDITFRQVIVIPTLMHWRKEVIENVFGVVPSRSLMLANRNYYARHIADGSHIAVVAQADGEDAGCGAICITEELPSPENPSGRCAYLMNIYVRSRFRSHGVGRSIVRWLLSKAREKGCGKIWLETTSAARPLYKSVGFREMPDIMKYDEILDLQP